MTDGLVLLVRGQQVSERFSQVGAVNLVAYHPEAGEYGLVQRPPHLRRRGKVQLMRVGAQQQNLLHDRQHGAGLGRAAFYDRSGAGQFPLDTFLFGLE
ncbi:hypothetical protein [Frankia sp. CcWB2]